jgi:hypothetical protein
MNTAIMSSTAGLEQDGTVLLFLMHAVGLSTEGDLLLVHRPSTARPGQAEETKGLISKDYPTK